VRLPAFSRQDLVCNRQAKAHRGSLKRAPQALPPYSINLMERHD
jgi:hypothetical protein